MNSQPQPLLNTRPKTPGPRPGWMPRTLPAALALALAAALLAVALLSVIARGQGPAPAGSGGAKSEGAKPPAASAPAPVRFTWVDAFVDAGDRPLGAYQIEFAAESGQATVVGVEGGEHPAYKVPPYYDPMALSRQGRLILAAYSTDEHLPRGKTRVARLSVMVGGDARPQYVAKLMAAADAEGKSIPATVTLAPAEGD